MRPTTGPARPPLPPSFDADEAVPVTVSTASRPPARRRIRMSVAVGVLGAVVAAWAPPLGAGAQQSDAIVIDDPRLHPSLAGVEVSGSGRNDVVAAARGAEGRRAESRRALEATAAALGDALARRQSLEEVVAEATVTRDVAQQEVDELRARLRELAVHSYQRGNSAPAGTELDLDRATVHLRQQTLVATVSTNQQAALRRNVAVVEDATARLEAANTDLATLGPQIVDLEQRRVVEERAVVDADEEVVRSRRALADWRIGADVRGTDIPLVVLDAYVKAAERIGAERPGCALRWWGLAGIGKVETRHGTYLGTRPGPNGVTLRPIVGIPLDGNNATAVIPDSDGGMLDGDPIWDRAVGPMQFIPGTWRTQARDGDGDGRADPNNVYDAALAAAGLLCSSGGAGLDQEPALRRAALGYNQSGHYADLVVRHAFDYAARADEIIPPVPDLGWLLALETAPAAEGSTDPAPAPTPAPAPEPDPTVSPAAAPAP